METTEYRREAKERAVARPCIRDGTTAPDIESHSGLTKFDSGRGESQQEQLDNAVDAPGAGQDKTDPRTEPSSSLIGPNRKFAPSN